MIFIQMKWKEAGNNYDCEYEVRVESKHKRTQIENEEI